MTTKRAAARGLLLVLTGCGGGLRFRDQPVIWRVDDARSIGEPQAREFLPVQWFTDLVVMRRLERALALPDLEPAWNVNALEEVPDSTWFTNRVGVHDLTPEETTTSTMEPSLRTSFVRASKTAFMYCIVAIYAKAVYRESGA